MEVLNNKQLMKLVAEKTTCPVCGTKREIDCEFVMNSSVAFRWDANGCIDDTGTIAFKLPNPSDVLRVDIVEFYCPKCGNVYEVDASWYPLYAYEE